MSNLNIIIDASVLAKWFFRHEEESKMALKIQDDFTTGGISITLPYLVFYEIGNLLKSAVIRSRLDEKKALKIYRDFLELDFEIYMTNELLQNSLEIAMRYDISVYDASYVAIADYLQIPLITADQKLLQKVKSIFVKSVEDYSNLV